MKAKLLLLTVSIGISLVAFEVVLRWLEPPVFPNAVSGGFFIVRSEGLGWEGKPGAVGHFAAGRCCGSVELDNCGIRLNGPGGTQKTGFRNILFIGDSNTAAFEVDGDRTTSALVETGLREQGLKVNIVNLGVRGYGTDQSVLRALRYAEQFQPEQIVYVFTDNDVFDNNVLREIGRRFGKGVYRDVGGGSFERLNYPVPDYEPGYWGAVVLDPDGRPLFVDGTISMVERVREKGWLDRSWRLYGWVADLRGSPFERKARVLRKRRADPFDVMNTAGADGEDIMLSLFFGLIDGGRARLDHRNYYDAQFEFLLEKLWEIPSLRKVHLVEFPNIPTLEALAGGRDSTNLEFFDSLSDKGVVQGWVSLSRVMHEQGVDYDDFSCRPGGHFTETGHRWISEVLLEGLDFDVGEADSRP